MKKNVWHTDIKCGCSWVPVDLDTGGMGGGGGGEERGKVEGSCSARAHRQTLKLVGGEVVHASPEMKRRVKGTCVKPREGETCIKPPEPTDVCGPDVTLALQNTVTRIRSVFNGWGVVEQSVKCTVGPWGFMWGNGWDIHELYVGAFGGYQSGRCASGVCERTVTVDHKCFHDWAVNYVAFGLMTRLCADAHLLPMKWLSLLTSEGIAWFVNAIMSLVDPAEYKYGDNAEKEPWVVAGFNYWPASAAPSAPSSTQDCSKCPLPPVPNRIFGWHWNGYKEGE